MKLGREQSSVGLANASGLSNQALCAGVRACLDLIMAASASGNSAYRVRFFKANLHVKAVQRPEAVPNTQQ